MFNPRLDVLPPPQRLLWPELGSIPKNFVLYGGTSLALRLGHRISVDFDFFTSDSFIPDQLLNSIGLLKEAKMLQSATNTLTVSINRESPVKVSFFGGLTVGRVGMPDLTSDGVLLVASLLDVAGFKCATLYNRAESKDYLDLLALIDQGITLAQAMAAARALYHDRYNPLLTLKALTHFNDGDLHKLTQQQKTKLMEIANVEPLVLPEVTLLSDTLSI